MGEEEWPCRVILSEASSSKKEEGSTVGTVSRSATNDTLTPLHPTKGHGLATQKGRRKSKERARGVGGASIADEEKAEHSAGRGSAVEAGWFD